MPLRHSMPSEKFTRDYLVCALWSSTDDNGEPLDDGGYVFAAKVAEALTAEALKFYWDNEDDCRADPGQAGHDLWLTRNRHGAGFWDGDWPHDVGGRLTDASDAVGGIDLYVGDDGMIHASGAVNA